MTIDPVQSVEHRIRELVNSPRRAFLLRQDSERWFKLCSSMDAIGDTQLAVRAFLDKPVEPRRSDGWSYVIVYGVLQVLYVQQDAAHTLADCLKLRFGLPDELAAIRDARNASIGHPTNYRRASSTAISRMSLSPNAFQMLVFRSGQRTEFRSVNVRGAAERQTQLMADLLTRAVEHLVNEEREHRRKFRARTLSGTLSSTLAYMLEKIGEGLRDEASIPFALAGVESVRDTLRAFRASLDERGVAGAYADSVGRVLSELEFVLERLSRRLDGGMPEWVERDGDVYWYFLHGKLDEVRRLAEEIDADYASDDV